MTTQPKRLPGLGKFSKPLQSEPGVSIASKVDDFAAEMPSAFRLREVKDDIDGDGKRPDMFIRWGKKRPQLYAHAGQLLNLCEQHQPSLADEFYDAANNEVKCNIRIGVHNGAFYVAPAA